MCSSTVTSNISLLLSIVLLFGFVWLWFCVFISTEQGDGFFLSHFSSVSGITYVKSEECDECALIHLESTIFMGGVQNFESEIF